MTPDALALLHARVFTVPRPFTASEFKSLLDAPQCFLLARPYGFALGRTIAGEAELLTLAVDPDHRRQGIATELLEAFEATARLRSSSVIFLEVDQINAPAIALYQKAEFVIAGQRRNYYRHPDGKTTDALVMRKTLDK